MWCVRQCIMSGVSVCIENDMCRDVSLGVFCVSDVCIGVCLMVMYKSV